jgi:membrane associated rhomboid family serine protease
MFIIPVGDRVDWKRPPLVTLLLILINCCVFFFFQVGDERQDEKAMAYYFSSNLPAIELNRYAGYLEKNEKIAELQKFKTMQDKQDVYALIVMERDAPFMKALHAGHIVTPQVAEYGDWSKQRRQYEAMRSFTARYVYEVDAPSVLTAFTSAFMHGGFDHLFGNMVVLFLVGFLVESVIGKSLFLFAYLVSAYAAVFTFGLTAHSGSLLGASGAIAGVMGLYTVIFGMRKIDFFYSLGFYFDYIRAPAIALLPLWLGNELYQYFGEKGSHVAYMAHFGGLLSGALIGVLYRWTRPAQISRHHEAVESKEIDDQAFQRGMNFLGEMEFDQALRIFKGLLEKHPQDANLARLVYRAAKAKPASEDYHQAALRLMSLPGKDANTATQTHDIFQEYMNCAKPVPKLGHDLVANLSTSFAGSGHFEDAEKLVIFLQRSAPQHVGIPGVLLTLARGSYRVQRKDKFEAHVQSILHHYPHSMEAATAANLLRVG